VSYATLYEVVWLTGSIDAVTLAAVPPIAVTSPDRASGVPAVNVEGEVVSTPD
jgi:hypothetical protein